MKLTDEVNHSCKLSKEICTKKEEQAIKQTNIFRYLWIKGFALTSQQLPFIRVANMSHSCKQLKEH